jgi:putative transposase
VAVGVSPTEAIRAEIHELFASDGELLSVLEQVARLSVRLTFQSVVEEIVCEELGRDRYQRRREDSPEGYRNGWHQPRTLKTAAGPVQLQRPKLRHAHAALCDQLVGANISRTNALERLVISGWVRGLSDRDVAAMLVEVFGQDATISRTTASRICQRLRAEFDAWKRGDLSTAKLDELFLDGSFFKLHPKARAEPVLAAWGIDTDGHAVFLGRGPGAAESTDAWRGFLEDLADRGLGAPLLVISDGGKGLCAAIECSCPPACISAVWSMSAATSPPRSPPTPKARSRGTTGRSSTRSSTTARRPSPRGADEPSGSSPSGHRCTPPRSPASPTTSTRCWFTCCSPLSIASASGTPP